MYIVVREWCHTDKKQLLQCLSRPMKDLNDAKSWKSFQETKYPKSRVFIVQEITE